MRTRLALLALAAAACRPAFDDDPSRIDTTRILAVRIEPPEAAPGETVTARALVVSPEGTSSDAPLEWATCRAPKSPTENRSVAPACLDGAVDPVGESAEVTFAVPGDACSLFGPETPPGNFRPRDPDMTGGYYQPVRVRRAGESAIALERILCNPSTVSLEVARELVQRYRPNRNPTLLPPTATVDGTPTALDGIRAGSEVRFQVGWATTDADEYVSFDPAVQAIVERREALRVSWFTTGGVLDVEATGREESDHATETDNTWRAPSAPGEVHFWAVLRDSRGGVDFTAWDVMVVGR